MFFAAAGQLALLVILGAMTRITFLVFALPVTLQAVAQSIAICGDDKRAFLLAWIKSVLMPVCLATLLLAGIVVSDTLYFRGNMSKIVLTPYNNLLYNLSPANLAEHGLHPRWLHVGVNLPLIVGPGLVLYGIMAARRVLSYSGDKSTAGSQYLISRSTHYTPLDAFQR